MLTIDLEKFKAAKARLEQEKQEREKRMAQSLEVLKRFKYNKEITSLI